MSHHGTSMDALRGFFDRCVCINLDRRPDRWERFTRNVADVGWPFAQIQRVRAVDGQHVPVPDGFRMGGGTYGCLRSHVRVLEDAIMDGVETLLVMEDDALFPQSFAEEAAEFLAEVPDDWEGLYLGGQHRKTPVTVSDRVLRVMGAQRTHCFAYRREWMRRVYGVVAWGGTHIDHMLEVLHPQFRVYAPATWLVGQDGGVSDISGRNLLPTFWQTPPMDGTTVVILCQHCCRGASLLAGGLRASGVHFGYRLCDPDEDRPWGTVEDAGLARICESAAPFPRAHPSSSREWHDRLGDWMWRVQGESGGLRKVTGMHYPTLALMWDAIHRTARGTLKPVYVSIPVEEGVRRVVARGEKRGGWLRVPEAAAETLQRMIDLTARRVPGVLCLSEEEILGDPEVALHRVAEYTGGGLDLSAGAEFIRRWAGEVVVAHGV